jgi:hypothetical protein
MPHVIAPEQLVPAVGRRVSRHGAVAVAAFVGGWLGARWMAPAPAPAPAPPAPAVPIVIEIPAVPIPAAIPDAPCVHFGPGDVWHGSAILINDLVRTRAIDAATDDCGQLITLDTTYPDDAIVVTITGPHPHMHRLDRLAAPHMLDHFIFEPTVDLVTGGG